PESLTPELLLNHKPDKNYRAHHSSMSLLRDKEPPTILRPGSYPIRAAFCIERNFDAFLSAD
ncbi:hypothetical protein ABC425_11550, partial [Brucella melitensis]|uniref:hypothetical protein n=1 Tax=Brucella melitensis TaxID=29459 RepID=UPI0031FDAE78